MYSNLHTATTLGTPKLFQGNSLVNILKMLSENSGHCRQVIAIRRWSITQVLQCLFLKLHMLGVFAFVCVGMCNLLLVYWCACVAVHVCVCVFFCAFIEYKTYLLSDVTVQTPG